MDSINPDTSAPMSTEPPTTGSQTAPIQASWNRVRALARHARMRFAHFVLLPELTPDAAFDLRQQVRKDGALTRGYILMSTLSAGIAILGLLQSSTAVVIGAMLVSPLMNPIAAMGFGFASLDGHRIRDAVKVVLAGAAIGILTGVLLTWLSPIRNATPEILARTQPTLLDLAVALFSGVAGGYATVIGRGGTAIGVAIATALMPPLAVVGYGIGVFQPMFAFGALLLFLTNLAAITFSFALVARLANAARPFGRVEWTPRYIAIAAAAFLALATPLSLTLMRLSGEAQLRSAAQETIAAAFPKGTATITQLDVRSPLFGDPSVTALVITPSYSSTAQDEAQEGLRRSFSDKVVVTLQQVLAADVGAQTRAMLDAAMERTVAGIANDVPPFRRIRESLGLPTRSIWTDRAQRIVYAEPVAAPGWTMADYREVERQASGEAAGWTVRLVPPAQGVLQVALPRPEENGETVPSEALAPDVAIWAIQRWGMGRVTVSAPEGSDTGSLIKALDDAGIRVVSASAAPSGEAQDEAATATIFVYGESPSQRAARRVEEAAAAAAAAEAASNDTEAP